MKNQKGLKRFQTIYNGFLHIGKKRHTPHDSIDEEVFAINCKDSSIELTKEEAINLTHIILIEFKSAGKI